MTSSLLFDLDGTLVDTDHEHLVAFQRVFGEYGILLDKAEYTTRIMGASNEMIGRDFLSAFDAEQRNEIMAAKEAAYRAGIQYLAPIAGAESLLDYADAHGLARAVVTNAPRANADLVLKGLGFDDRLPIRVIGSELPRSKPDPLPYLTGLELTGGRAEHSVAFEDSLSGARAAVAAGVAVVGMMTTLDADALHGVGVTLAVKDFRDPRIYELIESRRARA